MRIENVDYKKIGLYAKQFINNYDADNTIITNTFTLEDHLVFGVAFSLMQKSSKAAIQYMKITKHIASSLIMHVNEYRQEVIKNLSNVLPNIYQTCYNCKYRKNCKKIEYILNGGTGKSKCRCESYNNICHGCAYDRICGQTEEQQLKCLEGEKI